MKKKNPNQPLAKLTLSSKANKSVASPESGDDTPANKETILLVEDDLAVCEVVRRILKLHGYTLLEAQNGQVALYLLAHYPGRVNLLLTDVVMPGMSGMDLARQAARLMPNLKVLFMSGYTDEAIAHYGVLNSGVAFLQKPFSPMALVRKVQAVLDSGKS